MLNKEEAKVFFNKVKGKRIKRHSWSKEYIFIPELLLFNDHFNAHIQGKLINTYTNKTCISDYHILDGLTSKCWVLIDKENKSHLPDFL